MFWRVASFNQTSPVETVLDRSDFTLEDLLEEDDLIQECKALNTRLIDYLKKPESVAKLVEYITQPCGLDADDKRQFKYPFSSCEVLCCEVDAIFSTLLEDEALCDKLFSLLDQLRPLDCMLAGYFARVLVCLLMRRSRDLLQYLRTHQGHLNKLVAHMENTSMAEALAHLLGADDLSATFMAPGDLNWLAETSVLQALLDMLGSSAGGPARENAAIVLSAVARSNTCPLTHALGSAEFLDQLLTRATTSGGSGADVAQALDVPIALLERRAALENARLHYPSEAGPTDADIRVEAQTAAAVAAHAAELSAMLEPAHANAVQLTPFGQLAPPLGLARVKVAELFAALLGVGSVSAGEAVMMAGVLQRTLALVLQFPFNNILHAQATRMLLASLEYGDDALLTHLFQDCELIGWITSAPETVTPAANPPESPTANNGKSPKRKNGGKRREPLPLRAGYLGHLTLVANRMVGAAGRRKTIRTFLDDSATWREWSEGSLLERNNIENVEAWECGRPDPRSIQAATPLDVDEPGAGGFADELIMEKIPDSGGYNGVAGPGSPLSASRYAGAPPAHFGDVEEDQGASGNPGGADLREGEEGGQVEILLDAVKALDALRLGEGPRGRSPTLARPGGALSSPPSTPPALAAHQVHVPTDWEAETDAAGAASADVNSSPNSTTSPDGGASASERDVADVAVDLYRSPRSRGGYGNEADWANFDEPRTVSPAAPPASPGPLPTLPAAGVGRSIASSPSESLPAVRTTPKQVSSFTRAAPRAASSSPPAPRSPKGAGGSPGRQRGAPSSPPAGQLGSVAAAPVPIAAPAVMPPEGSVGPLSPVARVGSPSAALALPVSHGIGSPPGSPSRAASSAALHRPALMRSSLPSGAGSASAEALQGSAALAADRGSHEPPRPLHAAEQPAAAKAAALSTSAAPAASPASVAGAVPSVGVDALDDDATVLTGESQLLSPPQPAPTSSSAGAPPSNSQQQPQAFADWADFSKAPPPPHRASPFEQHDSAEQPGPSSTASVDQLSAQRAAQIQRPSSPFEPAAAASSAGYPLPQRRRSAELQRLTADAQRRSLEQQRRSIERRRSLEQRRDMERLMGSEGSGPNSSQTDTIHVEDSVEPVEQQTAFKRTGSLRAHNFWDFDDAPTSDVETESDRDE